MLTCRNSPLWQCCEPAVIMFYLHQVATALLVAGSTPTFWIPQFVSTSSYSSVVQALGCSHNCRRITYGSFQLTHMSRDVHAVQLIEPWRPKRRQNITALTTLPQGWISARKHQCTTANHYDVDRIFVGLYWELHWRWQLDRALERWRQLGDKRAHNSTTEVSFCTITIRLSHCMIAITRV